jgi:anti-anti-sigma regulatory factor
MRTFFTEALPGSMDRHTTNHAGVERPRITVRSLPDGMVVSLIGDHDLATKPDLLEALAGVRRGSRLIIDLHACTFVDSTIIAAILAAFQAHGPGRPDISVVMPPDTSYASRALSIVGLRDLVPTHLSIEAALTPALDESDQQGTISPARPDRS